MAAVVPEHQALDVLAPQPASPVAPAITARQFAVEAARVLFDTRCHNVAVLDVTGISPVTDFLVLANGTSPRQMRSASEAVEEFGDPLGHKTLSRSRDDSGQWIVLDFVDVVVHVFNPDARLYYDLDNLWGDAKRVPWEREAQAAPRADVH